MALRSRLAISIAAGALAAAAFAPPAVADDEWGSGNDSGESQGDWGAEGGDGGGNEGGDWGDDGRRFATGRVTANTLLLRSAPNRSSQVIRVVHRGDIVRIFCKTPGQRVQGNPLWYLLADGTWAWGAARFIDNVGPAPRWC
ncbi:MULTISPECIES: SH3 domain-containing protein [unclassified Streptomyces]|uniref:SH3 domain-containing protein n=1 Tax=unclassified Streptomyces TaxID=2593676 RepID=UPI0023668402|nr:MULTISPECIES: SH3 domain-containing protein [unclassified Streptomyces]MDF3148078.1 SH3 domain-containing protein [Streptomyces sp. T21Q-yed]WDF41233.1 SH3 domain-containing protein [Streptomyces sp. T12]